MSSITQRTGNLTAAQWEDIEREEHDWLPTSFALAHARDLLTEIEYGPAIAAAIDKVQMLLGADGASICLTEAAATVQHLVT